MPATPSDVEGFVARHWALASRLIGARARWVRDTDRDDTLSDGLLALHEAARTYDPSRGPEVPHVIATVQFRLIDHHRSRNGRADRGGVRTPPLHLDDHLSSVLPAPGDATLERLNAITVQQVLADLPQRHRDVLTAYYLEERTLAAIGRDRGVTESAVSHHVNTALRAARAVVDESCSTTAPHQPSRLGGARRALLAHHGGHVRRVRGQAARHTRGHPATPGLLRGGRR